MTRRVNYPAGAWPTEMRAENAAVSLARDAHPSVRSRATFRQVDLTRALKGARAAGLDVERVEIDPLAGTILMFAKSGACEPSSPLGKWKQNRARAS
jgi:hypothetical protein